MFTAENVFDYLSFFFFIFCKCFIFSSLFICDQISFGKHHELTSDIDYANQYLKMKEVNQKFQVDV